MLRATAPTAALDAVSWRDENRAGILSVDSVSGTETLVGVGLNDFPPTGNSQRVNTEQVPARSTSVSRNSSKHISNVRRAKTTHEIHATV